AGMNSTIPVVPRTGVASSSLLFLTSTVVASAGYFAATLILARQLGPGGRGTVAFATLSILAISRLARLGVPEAATVQAASSFATTRIPCLGRKPCDVLQLPARPVPAGRHLQCGSAGRVFGGRQRLGGAPLRGQRCCRGRHTGSCPECPGGGSRHGPACHEGT